MQDRLLKELFNLSGRVAVITGAAGLLGFQHATAIGELGANVVLLDVDERGAQANAETIAKSFGARTICVQCDITDRNSVKQACARVLDAFGRVDILVNNAANNPKIEDDARGDSWTRLENFPESQWAADIAVGLTGSLNCSQAFGTEMARRGKGVILNIASDLAIIGPDQRLYRRDDCADDQQLAKPVSYSVVKAGLLGLTRYLATYWADRGVRANALLPGGVQTGQDAHFVERLVNLIPLGRMALRDEYKGAVAFLVSDASSYMTGALLSVDGGRTCL